MPFLRTCLKTISAKSRDRYCDKSRPFMLKDHSKNRSALAPSVCRWSPGRGTRRGWADSTTASWDSATPSSYEQWNRRFAHPSRSVQGAMSTLGGKCFWKRQGSKTVTTYLGFSVPSSSSPYTTLLVSIAAVTQTKRFQRKDFVRGFFTPFGSYWLQSHWDLQRGFPKEYMTISPLPIDQLWMTQTEGSQRSLLNAAACRNTQNKISDLFSPFNLWEDWSFGTQRENPNLTLGWMPAEYHVWGGETARNEVTRRIPEQFRVVEWTFDSPSRVMMKIGKAKGRKALKLKLGMNVDFRTD